MPTALSHAVFAVAAAKALSPSDAPKGYLTGAVICSVLPDADVLTFSLGIPYHHLFGHRGLFHSLFFALCLGLAFSIIFSGRAALFSRRRLGCFLFFSMVAASHGILDAFTDGGLGVALFAPFDNSRIFLPWTPIKVSPIGISRFFSHWGYLVLQSELLWIWLPSAILVAVSILLRTAVSRDQRIPSP